jgi:predicted GNAT family N-acyltransferase
MPRMEEAAFVVRPVNWDARRRELRALRRAVFIEEQNVPEELEWDEVDQRAYHVLATTRDGSAVGTGRLSMDCQIGRMAVARAWRGRGVGSAVLKTLLDFALKEGCRVVRLHAQTHAIGFYERFGFETVGDEFQEAGIPHRAMELRLVPEALPRD